MWRGLFSAQIAFSLLMLLLLTSFYYSSFPSISLLIPAVLRLSYSRLIAPSSMLPLPYESVSEQLKTTSSLAELPKRLALALGPALLSSG